MGAVVYEAQGKGSVPVEKGVFCKGLGGFYWLFGVLVLAKCYGILLPVLVIVHSRQPLS